MKPEQIIERLGLEFEYRNAAAERRQRMKDAAKDYALAADNGYMQREFLRELDRNQWQNVILPNIQKRAMLARTV